MGDVKGAELLREQLARMSDAHGAWELRRLEEEFRQRIAPIIAFKQGVLNLAVPTITCDRSGALKVTYDADTTRRLAFADKTHRRNRNAIRASALASFVPAPKRHRLAAHFQFISILLGADTGAGQVQVLLFQSLLNDLLGSLLGWFR